jgi:hypothetical protein
MYGQYLVEPHVPMPTRSHASAVYKLSMTDGRATMKFSDNPENPLLPGPKSSLPGKPLLLRKGNATYRAQEGENIPGFEPLTEQPFTIPPDLEPSRKSPQTDHLMMTLLNSRNSYME